MGRLVRARFVLAERLIENGAVAVGEDRIEAVGDASELTRRFPGYEKLDAGRAAVIPGLVNTHTHAAMTLFRGYAEELTLQEWLERIWPIEAKLTGQQIYAGALLAAAEALLFGTTTINSMYFYRDDTSEAKAFSDAGLRAVVAHTIFEWTKEEALRVTERLAKTWHGAARGRLRVAVAPHAPYSVSPATLREARELADRLQEQLADRGPLLVHTHLAETRGEPGLVRKRFGEDARDGMACYLDRLGFLKKDVLVAHGIHLSAADYQPLAVNQVSVSTNPVSNLKVGMGIAPVIELQQHGINVGLGTDGPASNNSLDLFETMKLVSLLQKGVSGDATRLPARTAFEMATVHGARALKIENEIGHLATGYKADLVVVDLKKPHAVPLYDLYGHLVYGARSSDVRHVMVDGRLVVDDRQITTFNVEDVIEEVEKIRLSILSH